MSRPLAALLLAAAFLGAQEGRYRDPAPEEKLARWREDYASKKGLVPGPPPPLKRGP